MCDKGNGSLEHQNNKLCDISYVMWVKEMNQTTILLMQNQAFIEILRRLIK